MDVVNERRRDSKERERTVDTWALPVWLRLRDQRRPGFDRSVCFCFCCQFFASGANRPAFLPLQKLIRVNVRPFPYIFGPLEVMPSVASSRGIRTSTGVKPNFVRQFFAMVLPIILIPIHSPRLPGHPF